jgi:hypothetical protein
MFSMTASEPVAIEAVAEQRDALVGRLFQAGLGTIDLLTV